MAHAARVPVGRLAQTFVSHALSDFGAKKFGGRDFRRAAENRTPAACVPRAAAPYSTSTSDVGFNNKTLVQANAISRVSEAEKNTAVGQTDLERELVGDRGAGNGHPIRGQADAGGIRLRLQTPADVVRRPDELKLAAVQLPAKRGRSRGNGGHGGIPAEELQLGDIAAPVGRPDVAHISESTGVGNRLGCQHALRWNSADREERRGAAEIGTVGPLKSPAVHA